MGLLVVQLRRLLTTWPHTCTAPEVGFGSSNCIETTENVFYVNYVSNCTTLLAFVGYGVNAAYLRLQSPARLSFDGSWVCFLRSAP